MRAFEEPGVTVFDAVSGRVGVVKRRHEPGTYVSPVNQVVVQSAVLEMDDGQSFVLRDDDTDTTRFTLLDERKAEFVRVLAGAVNETLTAGAHEAAKLMSQQLFVKLTCAVLRRQADMLSAKAGA